VAETPVSGEDTFVCEQCNSVWMSNLETAARPVLERAIRHEPCILTEKDQVIAATC
jgi:hypothetical protein